MPIQPLPYGFGPWGEPACICVFGTQGTGKSTDIASAFPDAWLFGLPGGVRSASNLIGPDLYSEMRERFIAISSLHQVTEYLALMAAGKMERRPIIVDDGSLLAGNLHDLLRPAFTSKQNFAFWATLKQHVRALRNASRIAGVHVAINAHPIEGAPKWVVDERSGEREFVKAGPLFAGKSITPEIVYCFDMVLEVRRDDERARNGLWPSVYWSEPSSTTHNVKDRHAIVEGPTPMNLREIMKAAGYVMPRPRGLEWMDGVSALVAKRLDAGEERGEVFRDLLKKLASKVQNRHHIGWSLRDAFDAYDIGRRQTWMDRAFVQIAAPAAASINLGAALAGLIAAPAAPAAEAAQPEPAPVLGTGAATAPALPAIPATPTGVIN